MAERDWEPEYSYPLSWGSFRKAETYEPPTTTSSTSWGSFRKAETYEPPTTTSSTSWGSFRKAETYEPPTTTSSTSWGAFRMLETTLMPTGWSEAYPERAKEAREILSTVTSTPPKQVSTSTQQTSTTIPQPSSTSWGAFRIVETTLMPTGWSEAYPERAKEAREILSTVAPLLTSKPSGTTQETPTTQQPSKQGESKQTINGHVVVGTGKSGKPIYADDSPLVRWWKDIDNPALHQIIGNFFGLFEWDEMSPEERKREMARREEEFQRDKERRIAELENEIREELINVGYPADVAAETARRCCGNVAKLPKIYVPPVGEPTEEKSNMFFILIILLAVVIVVALLSKR